MTNSLALTIISFVITFVIESLLVKVFVKDWKKSFLYMFLINLFTWPLAQYFTGQFSVFSIELGVFILESLLIWQLFEKKFYIALLISLLINVVSFILGVIISMFIPFY
jgi:hypothetical protein